MIEFSLNCLYVGVILVGKNVYLVCNMWEEFISSVDDIIVENFEGE